MMHPSLRRSYNVPWTSGQVKLVADGNSITAGGQVGAVAGGLTGWLYANLRPLTYLASHVNVAIGGQTITGMTSSRTDVSNAYDSSKFNVLYVMEGTNEANTSTTPLQNFQKVMDYCSLVRADKSWECIVVCTAPPAYIGDTPGQAATDDYNAKLNAFNQHLRAGWQQAADAFIDWRVVGGPFDDARYPNYLKATFYDNTVVNGISNNASYISDSDAIKIHPTTAAIENLGPKILPQFLQMRRHKY